MELVKDDVGLVSGSASCLSEETYVRIIPGPPPRFIHHGNACCVVTAQGHDQMK